MCLREGADHRHLLARWRRENTDHRHVLSDGGESADHRHVLSGGGERIPTIGLCYQMAERVSDHRHVLSDGEEYEASFYRLVISTMCF